MEYGRPSLRLLAMVVAAAVPPVVVFAVVHLLAEDALVRIGAAASLLLAAALTVLWAGTVAVVAGPTLSDEARSLVELARRGEHAGDDELTGAQRRLVTTLDERNRQIAELAARARAAPFTQDAAAVVRSIVSTARSMTNDPTWMLAVLRSTDTGSLPAGLYGPEPEDEPGALEDVHIWASTLEPSDASGRGARHAIGPWGAFVVIDVALGDELRATLLAPWEGRPEPSPAELDLLDLLGQHAATAVEHAVLYARLRDQADELNRMAELQTDFLRGVSHDLQSPLTAIAALAAEVRDHAGLDAPAREDLAMITHQAERMRRMVGQLLAVSRLEAGALTPRQEVFRAEPVIRRTWQALGADRAFELLDDGPDHLVVGDPDRLEQVLWAVLDNAVKYSPRGSPLRVRLSAQEADGEATSVIEVRDEGAGMEAEALSLAFEQFYRGAAARRMAPDGSGIGLYAARGLVRAMGGEISAASRLGGGTQVTIQLPAELASASGSREPPDDA